MLSENIIAYDILESEKHSIKDLTTAVLETKNQNLRQIFMQMRDQAHQAHNELFNIAEQNGWYLSAGNVDSQHVSRFNEFFNQEFISQSQQQVSNSQNQPQPSQTVYQRGNQNRNRYQNPREQSEYNKNMNNQNQGRQWQSDNPKKQQQKQTQYGNYRNN